MKWALCSYLHDDQEDERNDDDGDDDDEVDSRCYAVAVAWRHTFTFMKKTCTSEGPSPHGFEMPPERGHSTRGTQNVTQYVFKYGAGDQTCRIQIGTKVQLELEALL